MPTHATVQPSALLQPTSRLRAGFASLLQYKSFLFNQNSQRHTRLEWSKHAGQWRLSRRFTSSAIDSSVAVPDSAPPQAAAPGPGVRDGQPKQPNCTPGENEDLSPAVREGRARGPKGSFNISADGGPAIQEGIWKTIARSLGFSTEDVSPQVRPGAPRAPNRSLGDSAGEGPGVREGAWRQPYMSPRRDVEVSEAMRAAADTPRKYTGDEGHGLLIGPFGTDFEEQIKPESPEAEGTGIGVVKSDNVGH